VGGCAATRRQAAVPKPVHGYADLDKLVRRHPGWAGVARYDLALARLENAANRSSGNVPSDPALAMLPSIPTEPDIALAPVLAIEQQRLMQVDRLQVARLRDRQSQSRARRLALDRAVWMRQAQVLFVQAAQSAQADYLQRIEAVTADRQARRVNLTLQIKALQKIVFDWKESIKPTPLLDQAQADLTKKQAELAALHQTQSEAAAEALTARRAANANARQARADYIAQQAAQEETGLKSQDGQQVAALETRLSQEQKTLLQVELSPPNSPTPPAGDLGGQTLPPGPTMLVPPAGATAHSLRASEANLRSQRARWLAFLYDDTRAAVLDAAGQHHWVIAFQRREGMADLTAPLAQALTVSVWKT
jgi:hypothetical protein